MDGKVTKKQNFFVYNELYLFLVLSIVEFTSAASLMLRNSMTSM